MRVRPYQTSDEPAIRQMFANCPFPYDFPELNGPKMESVMVLVDDDGEILMAAAAERILQIYLWSKAFAPAARLHGIRLLHEAMASVLREKGYNSCEAFLPPNVSNTFGKRLERTFGWVKNWQSWTRRF